MKNLCFTALFAFVALGFTVAASPAAAQTSHVGYVMQMTVDSTSTTVPYLRVRLSTSASGGTAMQMCTSGTTYAIYYNNNNTAREDTLREDFRAVLMSAFLAGVQVTVVSALVGGECNIRSIEINS